MEEQDHHTMPHLVPVIGSEKQDISTPAKPAAELRSSRVANLQQSLLIAQQAWARCLNGTG
jgi:hypothetical protein